MITQEIMQAMKQGAWARPKINSSYPDSSWLTYNNGKFYTEKWHETSFGVDGFIEYEWELKQTPDIKIDETDARVAVLGRTRLPIENMKKVISPENMQAMCEGIMSAVVDVVNEKLAIIEKRMQDIAEELRKTSDTHSVFDADSLIPRRDLPV